MNPHQHTVLALLIGIVVIRIISSGRLATGWAALTNAAPPTPQPLAANSGPQFPVQQGPTPVISNNPDNPPR